VYIFDFLYIASEYIGNIHMLLLKKVFYTRIRRVHQREIVDVLMAARTTAGWVRRERLAHDR